MSAYKICFCGNVGVGKSSIIGQAVSLIEDGPKPKDPVATIGMHFRALKVDDMQLRIWDLSGSEGIAKNIVNVYWRGADAVIFVYDITNRESWEAITTWVGTALSIAGSPDPFVLVLGNKSDLAAHRKVTTDEVSQVCEKNSYSFMETSAASQHNIREAIVQLCNVLKTRQGPKLLDSARKRNLPGNESCVSLSAPSSSEPDVVYQKQACNC